MTTLHDFADKYFHEKVSICEKSHYETIAGTTGQVFFNPAKNRFFFRRYDGREFTSLDPTNLKHVVSCAHVCGLRLKSGAQRRKRDALIRQTYDRRAHKREQQ